MKLKLFKIMIFMIFIFGLCVFLYPTVVSKVNLYLSSRVVKKYESTVKHLSKDKIDLELKRAEKYNDELLSKVSYDTSKSKVNTDYYDILNINGEICTITIPAIDVTLPVYHGTSDEVLKNGAGHMIGTTFPVGGIGTHAVITGHRGLPSSKLFSELDKLNEGDEFYINVLGKELIYKVDQIKVVLPDNTLDLMPVKDKDYITLVTCTPYGINSHRLFVRGIRTADKKPVIIKKADNTILYIILSASIIIMFIIIYIIYKKRRKSAKRIN